MDQYILRTKSDGTICIPFNSVGSIRIKRFKKWLKVYKYHTNDNNKVFCGFNPETCLSVSVLYSNGKITILEEI